MLDEADWHSEQTAHILLHQFRPNLRSKMVSPFAALAALQQDLQSELCYLSKKGDVILDSGSITIRSFANSGDVRTGYLCGAEAWRERSGSSTQVRLLRFEDLSIELDMAVRQELEGLGHLFALTVGAALHVEKTADLHTH